MPPVDEETAGLREELSQLVDKIKTKQEAVRDDVSLGQPGSKPGKTSVKKLLKGHINKVTCVHFSGDSRSFEFSNLIFSCQSRSNSRLSVRLLETIFLNHPKRSALSIHG